MAQNWFKHDYGARNDEKVLELRAEYGWKGYGLFFGLIETMCETETGCIDTDRIGGLCVAYNLPKDELLGFIDFCLEIDLFFEDEDGLIKNGRVIEHLDHMNTLKEAGKKGAYNRWKGHKNRGANGEANATPNADKIREDKIREDNKTHSVSTNGTDFPDSCKHINEARELANLLLERIKQFDPTHKYHRNPPSLNSWILDIERAMRLDGRDYDHLEWVINFLFTQNHDIANFWAPNIQSGSSLREKFDTIKQQLLRRKGNGQSKRENISNGIAKVEELDWD